MEQTLARYKQKLDESADLRKRVKEAEDAKEGADERVATLETELAKLQTLKVSFMLSSVLMDWMHQHKPLSWLIATTVADTLLV
jgi:hypothetical protein